jgi:CRP/FNR family transcriptional regulator, anaerobic regulatory protein
MHGLQPTTALNLAALRGVCGNCSMRELCLPVGLDQEEIATLDRLISTRRSFKRGESLYRTGDIFNALFAVRRGFFKTFILHEDGREQVTGFQMTGEILGMDAISTDAHACDAVALEDSEVCEVPFTELERLSGEIPALQRHFHKTLSREIVRDQGLMLLLGSMRAEERLAAFLLNFSQRFGDRGYSRSEFNLRMTREDIGSYLGMKLETVSRTLSKFQEEGLIEVHGKAIRLVDLVRLKTVTTCR